MITDVNDRNWTGRMEQMKVNITDQLTSAEYGLKTGRITKEEGAEIIAKALDVIDETDDMAKNAGSSSGGNSGRHKGGGGGGFGGGGGGGKWKQNAGSDASGDSGQSGQPKDFLELKEMINEYYSNTVTASASVPVTGTAAPAGQNNR